MSLLSDFLPNTGKEIGDIVNSSATATAKYSLVDVKDGALLSRSSYPKLSAVIPYQPVGSKLDLEPFYDFSSIKDPTNTAPILHVKHCFDKTWITTIGQEIFVSHDDGVTWRLLKNIAATTGLSITTAITDISNTFNIGAGTSWNQSYLVILSDNKLWRMSSITSASPVVSEATYPGAAPSPITGGGALSKLLFGANRNILLVAYNGTSGATTNSLRIMRTDDGGVSYNWVSFPDYASYPDLNGSGETMTMADIKASPFGNGLVAVAHDGDLGGIPTTTSYILYSSNGGSTWYVSTETGDPAGYYEHFTKVVWRTNTSVYVFDTDTEGAGQKVLISTDSGVTFSTRREDYFPIHTNDTIRFAISNKLDSVITSQDVANGLAWTNVDTLNTPWKAPYYGLPSPNYEFYSGDFNTEGTLALFVANLNYPYSVTIPRTLLFKTIYTGTPTSIYIEPTGIPNTKIVADKQ